MSNEIPEIEPCPECGTYPSIRTITGYPHTPKENSYFVNPECTTEICRLNRDIPEFRHITFSKCVEAWNQWVKKQIEYRKTQAYLEEQFKDLTFDEYLEARAALIKLQSIGGSGNRKAEDRLFNIIIKFFNCEFLEDARKELGTPHSYEERQKIMEKYFSHFYGETDDK